MNHPMIHAQNLRFSYGESDFCFNLDVEAGERVMLIGESGAGKSTFLHLLAGFLNPFSGLLALDGVPMDGVPVHKRPLSLLFQKHNLFEHLTVAQNIALGLNPNGRMDAAQKSSMQAMLARLGLEGMERRAVQSLSGGQQQRVALARTFLRPQPLVLLDEPFSALDQERREDLITLLDTLLAQTGHTLLMVSHHPQEAQPIMNRTLRLLPGGVFEPVA